MNFKNIPQKYRPIPFWSWNEKLNCEETKNQIAKMHQVGIGGFFMHARGGLQTEYMGDEWFENVSAAIDGAKQFGMKAWAYDENGWPSGFGDGKVNGLGVKYQQKYLRVENEKEHTDTHIAKCGDYYFYYDINRFYVDTLDKEVIKKFIDFAYEPYYEKHKNDIEGFFTDEPQISRAGIPWSFVFEDEYEARYGENLLLHLDELFFEVKDFKSTRIKFWKMVTELFSEAYMKQLYDWCDERGLKLTGHLLMEESMEWQITTNGACMPHYEYFHIPGMDWLGRKIFDCLTPMQLASVGEQLGKEAILSETFALCGHNVSFAELKGIYESQMVCGINLMCQHLEGYSIRGLRKRDYPPAMYYQQPWWNVYDKFIEAMSRVGMILAKGNVKVNVLVLHPMTTAWSKYTPLKENILKDLDEKFLKTIKSIERKHVTYHLGDEIIIERHGCVEKGKLCIGTQKYDTIITDCCDELLDGTQKLLDEFVKGGGKIISESELGANNVVESEEISYTVRYFDDFKIHYFVNTSPESKSARINVQGKKMDIYTGEYSPFCGKHEFEPWGSLVIAEDGSENITSEDACQNFIVPDGKFKVCGEVENALTLDSCDYYFDGELQEKNGYVLNITQRAVALERKVAVHQDYYVNVKNVPEKIYLVCETPEMFKITINGKETDKTISGHFVEKTFCKIDISNYLMLGVNTISFDCDFYQSPQTYENIKNSYIFESERNKLYYDMEIEPVYLVGDFSVETNGEWENLENHAERYKGIFEIASPVKEITLRDIHKQGYPFFCGELSLEGEIDIDAQNPVLSLETHGINAVKAEIGNISETLLTNNRIHLGDLRGKQKLKLCLTNNLRNLMGPHHLEEGECIHVAPSAFYKERCVWNHRSIREWNNDYCFVKTGIYKNDCK